MFSILLIIIFIAVLGIFMAWPEFSLYALVFFLPFIGWSFHIHNLVIPLADIVALSVLLAFALGSLWRLVFPHQGSQLESWHWPLFWPFAIFIVFSLVSAVYSGQFINSSWYVIRWPIFLYLAFILLPYNLVKNKQILKRSLIVFFLSTLVVLLSAYLSLYGQNWHNNLFQIDTISWFGIYPFGDNHNLIAEFLNAGAFIILALKAMISKETYQRLLNIIFLITAIAIILTFSRAAWITLFLQITIYLGYYWKEKKISSQSLVVGLAIVLILVLPLVWKMGQFQQSNASSTSSRWLLTDIAWQAVVNRPYWGYGGGQFPNLVANNIRYIAQYGAPIDAHGFLQKIAAENGIFGLVAWLFIIVYLIVKAYQSVKKYQKQNPYLLPLWLAGGGALFFQVFNTSYYKGKVWLPIALALVAVHLIEKKHESKLSTEN